MILILRPIALSVDRAALLDDRVCSIIDSANPLIARHTDMLLTCSLM